eukprot:Hpha_TRINITY_DN16254_c2_g1::TRINITY_DN16254_c2_g1_i1::g.13844::m.13844
MGLRECWRGWLVRPGDTPDDARIKTMFCPFALFAFLGTVFVIFATLQNTNQLILVIGMLFIGVAALVFIANVLVNALPVGYILDAALVSGSVGICLMDLANATVASTFRSWALVVLFLDVALVFKRNH